jgi:hypothetical protein
LRRLSAVLLALSLLTSLQAVSPLAPAPATAAEGRVQKGPDDVAVVAVIDFNFVPYHWDFLASKMPQATDKDSSNDLPLDKAPHTWLPGFPNPSKAFSSYNRFDLTLEEKEENMPLSALDAKDQAKWDKVKKSTYEDVHYYWFPDTKVIGGVEFGSEKLHGTSSDHGAGVSSVSVGNIHGTCPECLLVFINLDNGNTADAIRWAMDQPWIDAVSNSYGRGTAKVYNGPDEEATRKASVRGQTTFFSAGNGVENAFTVTNNTYLSSEKGPDWLITVGAVSPSQEDNTYSQLPGTADHGSYVGAGKPVDVASLGMDYPSAYGAGTVGGTGSTGFSGTSNAAPTIAGTYARALYLARLALDGPSRVQKNGVIARGAYRCASARPDCELKDGALTAVELRTRLLHGAIHTPAGLTTYAGGEAPAIGEDEFLNEGHGTYFARESGNVKKWLKEFARIIDPLLGRSKTLKRPEGEREWMIVDSFCRQEIWGSWGDGYYQVDRTELPGPDPMYPVRSSLEQACPGMQPPP